MKNFFLEKYNKPKNIRYASFKFTINLFIQRKLKIIVETGTARGKTKFFFFNTFNWKDGMSTPMFADLALEIDGQLHTCDISKKNMNNAKKFTHKDVKFYVEDSLSFLKNFPTKIDLLYLDSLDGHDPVAASEHQLSEASLAMGKLHENSLILLDDKGTKTNLSITFLLKNNFEILFETDFQVLLGKK